MVACTKLFLGKRKAFLRLWLRKPDTWKEQPGRYLLDQAVSVLCLRLVPAVST